jgi:hypothetical protein
MDDTGWPELLAALDNSSIVSPTGIAVRLRSGTISGTSALGVDGRATLSLVDTQQRPVTKSAAWDHDWPATSVIVGAQLSGVIETRETRERVRR